MSAVVILLFAATMLGAQVALAQRDVARAERDAALDRLAALHAEIGHAGDDIAQMGPARRWLDGLDLDGLHTLAPGHGTPRGTDSAAT